MSLPIRVGFVLRQSFLHEPARLADRVSGLTS